jgi:hypothetical protein
MDHTYNPTADTSGPVATGHDRSRQDTTGDDLISIKEAHQIFTTHGRAITERTLQRYCEKKQLSGQKRITGEGEKWFVLKSSVLTRIKELEEFDSLRSSRQVATGHDVSPSVVEETQSTFYNDNERHTTEQNMSQPVEPSQPSHSTPSDMSRPDATGHDMSGHNETVEQKFMLDAIERERKMYEQILEGYKDRIEDLVGDKKSLQADKEMLVEQLRSKDKQIDRFFASEHDTKTLAARLQSLVSAIWPSAQKQVGDRFVPMHDALESGLDDHRDDRDR